VHGNARLTPLGRLTLVLRIEQGRSVAHVAAEMGLSRATAYKWWRRWREEGEAGLIDRPSRAHRCPHRVAAQVEAEIARLRQTLKLGPLRIGARLGVPASTVHRVLVRLGLNQLRWLDRPTGRVIRRYERETPGELVHVDIKKLGRIPDGGGWRVLGVQTSNGSRHHKGAGYAFIHSAVDDHSRLAYSEILENERQTTCAEFWRRADRWFEAHGIRVQRVLTDNGPGYRSRVFTAALGATTHGFTRPYRPQTNGKVERFNRTLLEEWAYVRPYESEQERTAALADWLHAYNHHRHHTAIGGPPIGRVNNRAGQYS
jgi:transposase InsO family protein